MAQLSEDCFAHGGELMRLDAALALLDARLEAVAGVETVPLAHALGRILAEDMVSPMDVPPHDNSAVDGYAVYFDDLSTEADSVLPVAGRIAAGHPLRGAPRRGEAVRVFTGAPMPEGADDAGPDTIYMQEDCTVENDRVRLPAGIERGANRRNAGEDVRRGSTVLAAGRRLRAEDLGILASIGRTSVPVRVPLRTAVFSTGDELREPGDALSPGTVYDANRFTITALLQGLGCRVVDLGILPDRPDAIADALGEAAANSDLLVTSGGVSVGEEDHVRAVLSALGSVTFWRLAIKPGRPVALGHVNDGARPVPVVGLPGNPVAVMVTFLRFVRPLVLTLAGCSDRAPHLFPVRAGFEHRKKRNRREWVRCRLDRDDDGTPLAVKSGRQGAGVLSSVVKADGLVELPEEMTYLKAGTTVQFLPFSEVA